MNPDPFLAELVASDLLPPTPAGLAARVRGRLRRRRLLQRSAAALSAAALLAVGVLAWTYRPQADPKPPERAAYEMPEPAFLRSAPPVDTLDVLARQQAAYLTVLDQMEKEF